MKERKYTKEYQEWLDSKPVCGCGCGTPLNATYRQFVSTFIAYGRLPKFVDHHEQSMRKGLKKEKKQRKETKKGEEFKEFNGCNIVIFYNQTKRCDDFESCPEYLKCLEFVVIGNKANGWERIYLEKENI